MNVVCYYTAKQRGTPVKKYTKDGRTVLTGEEYQQLRRLKHDAAEGECEWCANPARLLGFNSGQLHHLRGRGGGRRDDTVASTVWICSNCHEQEHRPEAIH